MPANAEQQEPTQQRGEFGAIDVHALMAGVTLRHPDGQVTVRGVVEALRPWGADRANPTHMYGDLRDLFERATISFRCPLAAGPTSLHEHVVLTGTLVAKKSAQHRGYDLELIGSRVGACSPTGPLPPVPEALSRKRSRVSLEALMSEGDPKRLVLLGTARALLDAQTTLSHVSRHSPDAIAVTTDLESLKTAIAEAAPTYDALCLLRGGGDPESFATFNDARLVAALLETGKAFYTALGHSTDLTLADKYADGSYATPSDFGSVYAEALRRRQKAEQFQQELKEAQRKNRELRTEMGRRVESARVEGLGDRLGTVAVALGELQKLPGTLGRKASQSVEMAVRQSVEKRFGAATGRFSMRSWSGLLVSFLLGLFLGGLCFHLASLPRSQQLQPVTGSSEQQEPPFAVAPSPKPVHRKNAR